MLVLCLVVGASAITMFHVVFFFGRSITSALVGGDNGGIAPLPFLTPKLWLFRWKNLIGGQNKLTMDTGI